MKRGRKQEKKDFVRKSVTWKKKTAKFIIPLVFGMGTVGGFFSWQINHVVASTVSSNINSGVEEKGNQKYISEAQAELTASVHAGVTLNNTSNPVWVKIGSPEKNGVIKKCKLDREDGIMVYEIEFFSDGYEYDYKINAVTGEIISHKKEIDKDYLVIQAQQNSAAENSGNIGNESITYIGKEGARTIAYSHAGLTKENLYPGSCEMDRKNGISIYEVEFQSFDGYNYEYKIHAITGEVISSKKEQNPHYIAIQENRNGQIGDTIVYIHLGEAEYAATSHAGVTDYKMTDYKLEREDGIVVYEIEFTANGYEYDYKIQAMTGEVISYKKELEKIKSQNSQTKNVENSTGTFISEAEARNIAVQHSGVVHGALIVECELKSKNGTFLYEVEFKWNGFEYEYKINAVTAEIISFEKEWDD